jgi:prepilin-type N-terminal cleavage/methylation domain-containing protein
MKNKKSGFTPLEINSRRNLVSKKIAKANESIKIFPFSCGRHRYNGDLSLTGFTLLELLAVIAIISMLAAMILPNLGKVKIRARTAKAVSELKTIELALMEYYAEHGGLPTNKWGSSGLYKLFEEDLLETALADAFKTSQQDSQPYTYYDCTNGTGDTADSCIVFSVGPDGVGNPAANFISALNDAYPGMPADLDRLPDSDNIYLFVNVNASRTDPLLGREADIRYKK